MMAAKSRQNQLAMAALQQQLQRQASQNKRKASMDSIDPNHPEFNDVQRAALQAALPLELANMTDQQKLAYLQHQQDLRIKEQTAKLSQAQPVQNARNLTINTSNPMANRYLDGTAALQQFMTGTSMVVDTNDAMADAVENAVAASGVQLDIHDLRQLMMDDDADAAGGGFSAIDMPNNFGTAESFLSSFGGMMGPETPMVTYPPQDALQSLATLAGHVNKVSACSFSVDGKLLASGSSDKKISIWSTADGSRTLTLDGHTQQITCVRFCSDDRLLVASCSYDKSVRIWNISPDGMTATCLCTLVDHTRQVTAVDFACSPGNNWCCSIDAEGEVKLWNISTASCDKTITVGAQSKYGSFSANPLRFQPQSEGNVVAVALGGVITILDLSASADRSTSLENPTTRTFHSIHEKSITHLDWSPNGQLLLSGSEDLISVWDVSSGKVLFSQPSQTGKIGSCCFIPDTETITTISGANLHPVSRVAFGEYENLYVWKFSGNSSLNKPYSTLGAHSGIVSCVASVCSADGSVKLASGSSAREDNFKLWQVVF